MKFHEYFEKIEDNKDFFFVFIWKPEVKGPDVQKLIHVFHLTKRSSMSYKKRFWAYHSFLRILECNWSIKMIIMIVINRFLFVSEKNEGLYDLWRFAILICRI